jgi:stringent starvation protein B
MLPNKSYLVQAFYQWIVDSENTPYIVVDTTMDFVEVPEEFIENNQIVLNTAPRAIRDLQIKPTYLAFDARFNGEVRHLYAPMKSIIAVYAKENGRGMIFDLNDQEDADHPLLQPLPRAQAEAGDVSGGGSSAASTSHLKIIK